MKAGFILLFVAVLTNAENDHRFRRYIGGKEAKTAQFPYLVSLRRVLTDSHFCGGSIIHEQYILTAGHCLHHENRKEFYVAAGSNLVDSWRKRFWVDKFAIHSLYNNDFFINDIALIKLKKSFKFSKYIQKIALPFPQITPSIDKYPPIGATMTTSGFGRIRSDNSDNSDTIQYANVTSISMRACRKPIKKIIKNHYITNKHLCTLDKHKGFCKGDSGGPLVYEGKLVGIVSWMMSPCALGYPDIYVKVASYVNWIESTMERFSENKIEDSSIYQLETTTVSSTEITESSPSSSEEDISSSSSMKILENNSISSNEVLENNSISSNEVLENNSKTLEPLEYFSFYE